MTTQKQLENKLKPELKEFYRILREFVKASNCLIDDDGIKRIVDVELGKGSNDPSGLDMTRDIQERLDLFLSDAIVERIALNMEQIEQYNPPPNPAKPTDSRCSAYMAEFGNESWELDALDPRVITDLIRHQVHQYTDANAWEALLEEQKEHRSKLRYLADNWNKVSKLLETK